MQNFEPIPSNSTGGDSTLPVPTTEERIRPTITLQDTKKKPIEGLIEPDQLVGEYGQAWLQIQAELAANQNWAEINAKKVEQQETSISSEGTADPGTNQEKITLESFLTDRIQSDLKKGRESKALHALSELDLSKLDGDAQSLMEAPKMFDGRLSQEAFHSLGKSEQAVYLLDRIRHLTSLNPEASDQFASMVKFLGSPSEVSKVSSLDTHYQMIKNAVNLHDETRKNLRQNLARSKQATESVQRDTMRQEIFTDMDKTSEQLKADNNERLKEASITPEQRARQKATLEATDKSIRELMTASLGKDVPIDGELTLTFAEKLLEINREKLKDLNPDQITRMMQEKIRDLGPEKITTIYSGLLYAKSYEETYQSKIGTDTPTTEQETEAIKLAKQKAQSDIDQFIQSTNFFRSEQMVKYLTSILQNTGLRMGEMLGQAFGGWFARIGQGNRKGILSAFAEFAMSEFGR